MKCSKPHGYCFPIPGPCGAMSFLQPTCIHKSLWFSLRIAGNLLLVSLAELLVAEMAAQVTSGLRPRQLSLPGKTLPPSIPLILSFEDNWNTDTGTLETGKPAAVQDIRFKVVEDALALLRGIDKPLAVLSICGPYRSGKSYFISGVLGSPGTFKLGHSMQACTRGIWIATTVLENQEFAAVLLDTEGINAVGASETVAMSLLTLTTLLSSFLI